MKNIGQTVRAHTGLARTNLDPAGEIVAAVLFLTKRFPNAWGWPLFLGDPPRHGEEKELHGNTEGGGFLSAFYILHVASTTSERTDFPDITRKAAIVTFDVTQV